MWISESSVETVEHFLFYCPFSDHRSNVFKQNCLKITKTRSRTPNLIPKSAPLWKVLFISHYHQSVFHSLLYHNHKLYVVNKWQSSRLSKSIFFFFSSSVRVSQISTIESVIIFTFYLLSLDQVQENANYNFNYDHFRPVGSFIKQLFISHSKNRKLAGNLNWKFGEITVRTGSTRWVAGGWISWLIGHQRADDWHGPALSRVAKFGCGFFFALLSWFYSSPFAH